MLGLSGKHQQDPDSQLNHAKSSCACHVILDGGLCMREEPSYFIHLHWYHVISATVSNPKQNTSLSLSLYLSLCPHPPPFPPQGQAMQVGMWKEWKGHIKQKLWTFLRGIWVFRGDIPIVMNSNIQIYKIYSLTQLSNKQLILKGILHIIFHSYMFQLVSMEPS